MSDNDDLSGIWDVLFVGATEFIRVDIDYIVVNSEGHHLYIVDKDESLLNWSTIVKMKRPE